MPSGLKRKLNDSNSTKHTVYQLGNRKIIHVTKRSETGMKIHEASKILILGQIVGFTVKRGAVVTSRCHGSKISGSQQTVLLQIWQKTQKS